MKCYLFGLVNYKIDLNCLQIIIFFKKIHKTPINKFIDNFSQKICSLCSLARSLVHVSRSRVIPRALPSNKYNCFPKVRREARAESGSLPTRVIPRQFAEEEEAYAEEEEEEAD